MFTPIDMNSLEWLGLNDEERYERIAPICQQFIREFNDLAEVKYVGHTPFSICVGTLLPDGEIIEQLPRQFHGIPVQQEGMREAMDWFLATWRMILEKIGGWTPEQIADYANDRHSCFDSSWFLHYSPISWVPQLLLPPDCKQRLVGLRSLEVSRSIEAAIIEGIDGDPYQWRPEFDPHYDWAAARERVNAVIEELRRQYAS